MTCRRSILRRLARESDGVTAVEFGLLAIPLVVLLIGGLDLGYQNYVRTVMQGALNDAARIAAVENPEFNYDGKTTEEQVENMVAEMAGSIARDATITVKQTSYYDFSDIGDPETLMTDVNGNGEYDKDDNDCYEDFNRNGLFDTDAGADGQGGSNDVVFYEARVQMPRLFPLHNFINVPSKFDFTLDTAIRQQPYSGHATPPVLCGTDES